MGNLSRYLGFFGVLLVAQLTFAADCVGPIEALGGVNPNPQRIPTDPKSKVKKKPANPEPASTERGPAATVEWSPDVQERLKLHDLGFKDGESPSNDEILAAYDELVKDATFDLAKYKEALDFLRSRGRVK